MPLAPKLLHASSARFADVEGPFGPSSLRSARILCGNVNAQDEMNVYTGFHRFAVSLDGRVALVEPAPSSIPADEISKTLAAAEEATFRSVFARCRS